MSWGIVKRMVPKGQRPHPLVSEVTAILWMAEPVSLVCTVYLPSLYVLQLATLIAWGVQMNQDSQDDQFCQVPA